MDYNKGDVVEMRIPFLFKLVDTLVRRMLTGEWQWPASVGTIVYDQYVEDQYLITAENDECYYLVTAKYLKLVEKAKE